MIDFHTWAAGRPFGGRADFLILGKGPTFARRCEFDLSAHVTISLNHVVTEQSVDIAHMIDFEVAEACAQSISSNARWLLMPRHPHIGFRPTLLPLEDLLRHVPALAELEAQRRIVCYDLASSPVPARGPTIDARFFSCEAAVEAACRLGARRVSTLGVDGGTKYAGAFSALDSTTRLANGQPSFSLQFDRLEEISRRTGVEVEPLIPPLKIFVGVQEGELVAARVLEFTINEHSTQPVQVVHLPRVGRIPRDPLKRQRTPFSFSRFLIPELTGYRGRALYLDSDMQVFADISTLWGIPFAGAKVMCTNQTYIPPQWRNNPDFHPGRQLSVMMLDCSRLPWKIDEIIDALDSDELTYEQLMFELALVPPEDVADVLPEGWNHLEHYVPGETKLLHYTAVPTQPWKVEGNPNQTVWEGAFVRACEAGYLDAKLIERHSRAGHVRASLRALVPPATKPTPTLSSATLAELEATRIALALRRGRPVRAALNRLRRSAGSAEIRRGRQ